MIDKIKLTSLATALGLVMVVALFTSPMVRAEENPFSVSSTSNDLVLAGKDGKCGDGKKDAKCADDDKEGKCGEGKCSDSKKEAKCADGDKEGKCGDSKKQAKCGEGKCGDGKE